MRKIAFAALVVLGAIISFGTSSPALAGACEARYTMAIAACNGNGPCGDAAESAYIECLRSQVEVKE